MNESTEATSAFDQLVAANPFPAGASAPKATTSQQARFEEIIMHKYEPAGVVPGGTPTAQRASSTTAWWRRRLVAPVLASVMALLAIGVVIGLGTIGGAPSAVATLAEASEKTAALDFGAVSITMDIRELDDIPGSGQVLIDYRYDFDDYQISWRMVGDGADSPDAASITQIWVDGIAYQQEGDDPTFRIVPLSAEDTVASQFGLNRRTITLDALLPLLESSGDFTEITETGTEGRRDFSGTIATASLIELDRDDLPAGLGFFGPEDLAGLPPTMSLDVQVENELLRTTVLTANGETDEGAVDFTITIEYRDFGQRQNITIPDGLEAGGPIEIMDPETGEYETFDPGFSPEEQQAFDRLFEVSDELFTRRPGLCDNRQPPMGGQLEADELRAALLDHIACFDEVGEPQMADAMRNNPGYGELLDQ